MSEGAHSIVYGPINKVWDWIVSITGQQARWGELDVPEHVAGAVLVLILITVIFVPLRRSLRSEEPGKLQLFLEMVVQGLKGMMDDQIGHDGGRRHMNIIGSFAVFIFLCNICGLFFFLQPPTQNPNVTFALSITAFVYYNLVGFRKHGIGYLKQLAGPIWWLAPLFIPIEIISHLARVLSLGLRLFGNIFGEHLVVASFVGLVPLMVPLPLMGLGVFAAVIQTFVFVMLTTVYLAGAEAEAH